MIQTWDWYEHNLIITCVVNGQYVTIGSECQDFGSVVAGVEDHVGGEIKAPGIVWLSVLTLPRDDFNDLIDRHNLVTLRV